MNSSNSALVSLGGAAERFRESLLVQTLRNAVANSPFYSARYGATVTNVKTIRDLPDLPVLTKQDVVSNLPDLLCSGHTIGLVQHTTGTTGQPLPIYRSVAEMSFTRSFLSEVLSEHRGEPLPLVMNIADLYHGPTYELPGSCYSMPVGLTDDILLSEAVRILSQEHQIPGVEPRVSVLVGLVPYLKTLTNYLIETEYDFSRSHVKLICPLCTVVTPRWRKLLAETWGAAVVDRYSLSEIFGGASRCPRCCSYHFDPTVIAEVVDPFSHAPVTRGIGMLVLTSLYPFVQLQPMIRYVTGDLVEISDENCVDELSVIFKGRLANACRATVDGSEELLILPVDLNDVMDDLPDVAVSDRFIDIRGIRDHTAAGASKFRVDLPDAEASSVEVRITVELRYSPYLYPDRVRELEQQIFTGIVRRSTRLATLLCTQRVRLRVHFVAPGELPVFALKI